MIARRDVVLGTLALAAVPAAMPRMARAASRIVLRGAKAQGGLVIGEAKDALSVTVDGMPVHVEAGLFAFGIAYDRTAPFKIGAKFAGEATESAELTPVVRRYEVQHINGLPQKFVTPRPEDLARIHRENAHIVEARKHDGGGVGFAEGFDWPFPGILSGVYGSQRIDNGVAMAPHLGVDIAAPEGTPIHAPASATVLIADDYFLDGGFTLLDHGHGVTSCYLHQSRRLVAAGDRLTKGQIIGHVGHTGRATGPHSHWGLNWFQLKLDPSLATPSPVPPRV